MFAGKKIGPDPRNFNQRVSREDMTCFIRTFPNTATCQELFNTCAANGGSQLDHSAMVQALELMANHKLS